MELDDNARGVCVGHRTMNGFRRTQHVWPNAHSFERLFDQAIKVRGENHADVAELDQVSDGFVRRGRCLSTFFSFLLCRLKVGAKQRHALLPRGGKIIKQI